MLCKESFTMLLLRKKKKYDSAFIRHETAVDLVNEFKNILQCLQVEKFLQVSIDGPNVNCLLH